MKIRYVFDQVELVAGFVARMIPHVHRDFGRCSAIGVVDERNELIAGFVYHQYHPESGWMEISGAALPGYYWLTPRTLQVLYDYPFLHCYCQMVIMRILADDERLKRQLAMVGYSFIPLPRHFGRHQDGILAMLTEEDWRENKHFVRARRAPVDYKQSRAA